MLDLQFLVTEDSSQWIQTYIGLYKSFKDTSIFRILCASVHVHFMIDL